MYAGFAGDNVVSLLHTPWHSSVEHCGCSSASVCFYCLRLRHWNVCNSSKQFMTYR